MSKKIGASERQTSIYMSDDRYVAALKRQRDRIADGEPLVAWDCDDIGAKDTHCSWGLCSNDKDAWPHATDHLWPDQFSNDGRVAPLYRRGAQVCPMQRGGQPSGCFYSCRIFKPSLSQPVDRAGALELYDAALANAPMLNRRNPPCLTTSKTGR